MEIILEFDDTPLEDPLENIEIATNSSNENAKATLSIITYNLCCQNDKEDLKEIFDVLLKYNSDLITIQGLTKHNCDVAFRIMKSNGYSYSRFDQISSSTNRTSFEILFSKIPITKKEYTPFVRTIQHRGLSKYLVTAGAYTQNPTSVWIYTSHFETDIPGNSLRKIQIAEIDAECTKTSKTSDAPTIFAGDTSIPSWQAPNLHQPLRWLDSWREKGTSQNEKTSFYDRMDQIWLRENSVIHIEKYERVRINSDEETRAGVYVLFKT